MEQITIEITKNEYASAKEARRKGLIPLICYNREMEPVQYTVEYQGFRRAYLKAGKSSIISLMLDGKPKHDVLVHEVQYAPVSDDIIHVDMMVVRKGQKLHTEIPLVFVGESPAVREQGGILITNKNSVGIECLPTDLLHEIEVDISSLVDFHSSLTVGDIKVPATIRITDAPEISIITVSAPRSAIEEETSAVQPAASTEAASAPAASEKK